MATDVAISLEEQVRRMTPVAAPPEQRAEVEAFFELLERGGCKLVGPSGQERRIPESLFFVLERVAEVLARGDSITVVPVGQELTTQQAADILNVSRQYLVRLLDDGHIAYTKTGKHRRVRIEDVLAYKEKRDAERKSKLSKLTELSQEFGRYDELK